MKSSFQGGGQLLCIKSLLLKTRGGVCSIHAWTLYDLHSTNHQPYVETGGGGGGGTFTPLQCTRCMSWKYHLRFLMPAHFCSNTLFFLLQRIHLCAASNRQLSINLLTVVDVMLVWVRAISRKTSTLLLLMCPLEYFAFFKPLEYFSVKGHVL